MTSEQIERALKALESIAASLKAVEQVLVTDGAGVLTIATRRAYE